MAPDGAEWVIEMAGATKRFGSRVVVDGVDLRVPAGCSYGLLGMNGAGKTTLIRMLLGLTPASAGTMTVLGLPMPDRRREALARVGAIVEEPRFHPHLSGRENLAVAAAARGAAASGRIGQVLERVGLSDRARDRVGRYSLGMRQRLGIARCLLSDPALLILDEPTNGLDPAGILQMRSMIRSLVDEGRTVMISSHLLDEVEKTCDQVAILDAGRLVAAGPVRAVAADDQELTIGCASPQTAARLLHESAAVRVATVTGDRTLRVTPALGYGAARINRILVGHGVEVMTVEPVHVSLEERFLRLITHLHPAA